MDYNDNDMEVRSSELCSTVLAARCREALILIMILYNDSDIFIHSPCRGASIKRATPCVVLLASLLLRLDI